MPLDIRLHTAHRVCTGKHAAYSRMAAADPSYSWYTVVVASREVTESEASVHVVSSNTTI